MLKTLALALILCEIYVNAQNDLIITLSNFQIESSRAFSDVFNCARDLNTYVTTTVATDLSATPQSSGQIFAPNKGDLLIHVVPDFNYTIQCSQINLLLVMVQFSIWCDNREYPDSAILLWQDKTSPQPPSYVGTQSSIYNFTVSSNFYRSCLTPNFYGFNCDQPCSYTHTDTECYNCNSDGSRSCCSADQNPGTCTYKNVTLPSSSTIQTPNTVNGNNSNSDSKEKLFMWIMIGLAIILFVLIVIIVIALFVYCCRQPSKVIVAPAAAPVTPQYIPAAPVQPRPLPPYEYNNFQREQVVIPDQSRRNTHTARPVVTQDWDDESLASDWVEPQPRRVAQRPTVVSRTNSSKVIEEPLDIVV